MDDALRNEAIEYAREGRYSHATWAEYLEHCEGCADCRTKPDYPGHERLEREIGTLAEQREWVRKYDVILAALGAGSN